MNTSSKSVRVVIAVLAGGALLFTALHNQPSTGVTQASTPSQTAAPAPLSASSGTADAALPASASVGVARERVDYAAEFRRSTDYHGFIKKALAAAQAG